MSIRAAMLTLAMMMATSLWGLAVYTDGALAGNVPADGYGVSVAVSSN